MLALKDRVKELTTTTGTGTLTLVSAPTGYRRFSAVLSNADTTYYCIESGSQWEVGVGTYSANTLARTTVLASSNSNSLIDIVAARSFVFVTYAADKAVYKDGSERAVMGAGGLIFSDASVQTTAATSPDLSPYLTISSAASTYLTQSSATTLLAAKADLVGGLIPSAQLPSYVDDVVEAANLAAFPGTGETGKIYVAIDTGYTYRWSGSVYVRINEVDLSSYLTTSTAASTYLPLAGGTLTGDLLFTDALYDIGKSGATRPRDGWFSRNLSLGGEMRLPSSSNGIYFSASGNSAGRLSMFASEFYIDNAAAGGGLIFRVNSATTSAITVPSTGIAEFHQGIRGTSNVLKVVNSTNAQTLQLHETYTSSTSFGTFQIKANNGAAYQIGSAKGSAGGSNQAIAFGHWDAAGAFSSQWSVLTTGVLYSTAASGAETLRTAGGQYIGGTMCNLLHVSFNGWWGLTQTSSGGISFGSGNKLVWGSTTANAPASGTSGDIGLARNDAGVLEVNTGTIGTLASIIVGSETITQRVSTSGSPTAFTITDAAHTTMTASTEATSVNFNLSSTKQFATGALTTQRAFRVQAPTYSFVGASTITTASTLSISGPPAAGTNATITNAYALNVEGGKVHVGGEVTVAPGSGSYTKTIGWDNGVGFESWSTSHLITLLNNEYSAAFISGAIANPGLRLASTKKLTWSGNSNDATTASAGPSVSMSDATLNLTSTQVRNSTIAQYLSVYNTYTSSTSYERVNLKGVASANFEIGPENGSAGGTLRGLTIGGYPAGTATIVGWAQFRPNTSTGALEAFYLGPIADSAATGGNARGQYAVDLITLRTAASQVVSGARSFGAGARCQVSGNDAYCIGNDSAASGQYSVSFGTYCVASNYAAVSLGINGVASGNQSLSLSMGNGGTASALKSFICGEGVSSAQNAWATGFGVLADRQGMSAYAQGYFAANGDAQKVDWILRKKTTDATPVNLFADGSSVRLTISSGKTMTGFLIVKGIKSDGSAKARFVRLCDITNVGGTTSLDTPIEAIGTDYNPSGCTLAVTAENATDDLQISITGPAGETWRWTATFSGLEIAYGT